MCLETDFDRNSFCDYANSIKERFDTWNCGWGISWWRTKNSCKNQTVKTWIHTCIKVKLNQDLKIKVGCPERSKSTQRGVHLAGRTFAFINIYSLDTASGCDSESRGEVSAQLLEKSGGKIEIAQTGELRSDGVFDCGAAVGGWLNCVLEVASTRYQVLSAVLLCLSWTSQGAQHHHNHHERHCGNVAATHPCIQC